MNKVILRADVIRAAPGRWQVAYRNYSSSRGGDKAKITELLLDLKAKGPFTAEQVDEIIGNQSWTCLQCEECEQNVDAVYSLSLNKTAICLPCAQKAVEELTKALAVQP